MEQKVKIKIAAQKQDPLERQLHIASIISTELQKYGTTTVLVGGSALEFYTQANYLTTDIDLVTTTDYHVKKVMDDLGFSTKQSGVYYLKEYPQVLIDFRSGPLEGTHEKTQVISTDDDHIIHIIGIEDMIIDRACHAQNRSRDSEWVNYMIMAYDTTLDWTYLEQTAKYQGCLEVISNAKKWSEQQWFIEKILELDPKSEKEIALLPLEQAYRYNAHRYLQEYPHIACNEKMDIWIAEKMLEQSFAVRDIQKIIIRESPCIPGRSDLTRSYVKPIIKRAIQSYNENHDIEIPLPNQKKNHTLER